MFFDSHAHYDDSRFEKDMLEVIRAAHDSGVSYILNAASNISSVVESIALTQKFDFVYASVGVHPHEVGQMSGETLSALADFAVNKKVVAVGEIGLDYYYDYSPRELQRHWLAEQIGLARNLKLPVIIHDREAHEDALRIVKKEKAGEVGGVFHCFSGSVEMARELLKENFYISVGGPVTYKNARKTVEVIEYIPMDHLLIETDCPYLTPEPYRGKRNDSSYIHLVAEKIAQIKNLNVEEVARITTENTKRLFKIS